MNLGVLIRLAVIVGLLMLVVWLVPFERQAGGSATTVRRVERPVPEALAPAPRPLPERLRLLLDGATFEAVPRSVVDLAPDQICAVLGQENPMTAWTESPVHKGQWECSSADMPVTDVAQGQQPPPNPLFLIARGTQDRVELIRLKLSIPEGEPSQPLGEMLARRTGSLYFRFGLQPPAGLIAAVRTLQPFSAEDSGMTVAFAPEKFTDARYNLVIRRLAAKP